MKVTKLAPLAGIAAALIAATATVPATAVPVATTQSQTQTSEYQKLINHLAEDGVPANQQNALARKVLAGKMLDSAKGGEPSEVKKWSDAGFDYTKDIYSDGSYEIVKMQKANAPASSTIAGPQVAGTITGCISTTGSGYVSRRDCTVTASTPTYRASFVADYTHSPTLGTIGAVRLPKVEGYGGVASGAVTAISRARSDGRLPATAYVRWNYTGAGGLAGGTSYLYLKVTATTATAETD